MSLESIYCFLNEQLHIVAGSISSCLPNISRAPASPDLSAQEGELDNLLTIRDNSGWEEDVATTSGYGKGAKLMADSQPKEQSRIITGVRPSTWLEGRTMEELEREEAELARMDIPGPPMVEFGDFEEGRPEGDESRTQG
jgi:hypothetical protein